MHKKPDVSKLHMHVYRQKCRLNIIPPNIIIIFLNKIN